MNITNSNTDMPERLQSLRKKAGYSQEQLAELLGISRQAVSKWESGQGKPETDNIIKLIEIYNVSADYILIGNIKAEIPFPEQSEQKDMNPPVCQEYISPAGTGTESGSDNKELKTAFAIILTLAGVSVVGALFIAAMSLISTFL